MCIPVKVLAALHPSNARRHCGKRNTLRGSEHSIEKAPSSRRASAPDGENAFDILDMVSLHPLKSPKRTCSAEGQNSLHVACLSHPKLHKVKTIVNESKDFAFQSNSLGQLPLHVAAACGASPPVIDYLLELNADAASTPDSLGRTPLLLACSTCTLCDIGDGCNKILMKGPVLRIIKALCNAAPASINMEDTKGMSALEYAIYYEASLKIVRALQKTSEKEWKYEAQHGRPWVGRWKEEGNACAGVQKQASTRIFRYEDATLAYSASGQRRCCQRRSFVPPVA